MYIANRVCQLKCQPFSLRVISLLFLGTMASLIERLQKVQVQRTEDLPDLSQYSLEQLNNMKLDFGSKHLGKSFQEVWEKDQPWISWFLKHYQHSTKGSHRLMVHYIGLKVERAELEGSVVPVSEPSPLPSKEVISKGNGKSSTMGLAPKAKAKAMPVALMPNFTPEAEDLSVWDMEEMGQEVMIEAPVDVSHLEQRMLHMENAIQTIVQAIEQMSLSQGQMSQHSVAEH